MPKDRTRDMTVGAPMPILLSFILPLLLGLLFQQFYSMVDTVVVGNFLGMEALAGVGSTGSINFLVLGLCNGVCAGFAIPVAQKFGEKDFDGLRNFVGNMIWLGGFIALVVTAVTTVGCRAILTAMDTPESTFSYAYDYIFLIFLGIPATMLYNLLSSILRSLGDSRTPLMFSGVFQPAECGPGHCVRGDPANGRGRCWLGNAHQPADLRAAVPAVYGQEVPHSAPEKGEPCLAGPLRPAAADHGPAHGPAVLHYRHRLHSAANGGQRSGRRVHGRRGRFRQGDRICSPRPYDAMGTMAATYAGQNLGAGKLDRVHHRGEGLLPFWASPITPWWPWSAMYFGWSAHDAGIVPGFQGRGFLRRRSCLWPGNCWWSMRRSTSALMGVNLFRFTIQGLGYSNLAVIAGVFEMIARGGCGVGIGVRCFGFTAVCYASPAAWVLADCFLIPAYFVCMKRRKKEAAAVRE